MLELQIITDNLACLLIVDDKGIINYAAPILQKFRGQSLRSLLHWSIYNFKKIELINLVDSQVMFSKTPAPKY